MKLMARKWKRKGGRDIKSKVRREKRRKKKGGGGKRRKKKDQQK